MPPDDRFRSDDHERLTPVCPEAKEDRPQKPVGRAKSELPAFCSLEDSELVSESQNLELKGGSRSQA